MVSLQFQSQAEFVHRNNSTERESYEINNLYEEFSKVVMGTWWSMPDQINVIRRQKEFLFLRKIICHYLANRK